MRWNDLLDPERAARAVLTLFAVGFVLLAAGSELLRALGRTQPLPSLSGPAALLGVAAASLAAYAIRERRRRRPARPRSTRGAERTPLVPRTEEEDE